MPTDTSGYVVTRTRPDPSIGTSFNDASPGRSKVYPSRRSPYATQRMESDAAKISSQKNVGSSPSDAPIT